MELRVVRGADLPEVDPNVRSRFVVISVEPNPLGKQVAQMDQHRDCLAQPYVGDHDVLHAKFTAALAQAFDLDPYLVAQLDNLDRLRLPSVKEDCPLFNCAQALTLKADPIGEVLSFLFSPTEPVYGEPYAHGRAMYNRIINAITRIAVVYGSAAEYFRAVSLRLWRPADYLAQYYSHYMALLQAQLDVPELV